MVDYKKQVSLVGWQSKAGEKIFWATGAVVLENWEGGPSRAAIATLLEKQRT